ncbi:hypothetical protein AVMA1855_02810 [Acidovorax sp. SUPP1855]|uniref:hypothetical protein n=1 Tax=Acidovorax sp. SUPP1855 TaxID=431774 RepID=UPI0023DE2CB0|nr:hypothetical protein [Acidovorax sp. SUPP1855]GKS83036.1 hypothetical protein AVMA1855_02810 [Acidovorax sp. SUPP1855]
MAYVIQSGTTGAFLAPSMDDGQPEWVMSLREACPVVDLEDCAQLIEDHAEPWHRAQVIDLTQLHRPVSF